MIGTDFQSRNNGSDMDSDSIYTTNQKDIVEYAKYCYANFPTIENNIPKEKNIYNSSPLSFAVVDNNLAAANMAIGESSNLAQIALSYSGTFSDKKYLDYVCILSVVAQAAIDNAKRAYDIDLNEEISIIKKDMDLKINGYPEFFVKILRMNRKNDESNMSKDEKMALDYKYEKMINPELKCPMNYLNSYDFKTNIRSKEPTIDMSEFFVKFKLEESRRKSKKVEELIHKYSINLFHANISGGDEDYLLLREDFDQLIEDIRMTYISKSYLGLMSWLIDRAFCITPGMKKNANNNSSNTNKNKSLLLKTLYDVNKDNLLKCFSKNVKNIDD